MEYTTFGTTGLKVSRTGFGGIPIQRISFDDSTALLTCAYDGGVTLYDTAAGYTTSEERIGTALSHVRDKIILCTKAHTSTPEAMRANLERSLRSLKTDHIDIYQFHNPSFVPRPDSGDGLYECMTEFKSRGMIRHIGITSHSRQIAHEAAVSGLYESLQYPLSYLSSEEELSLIGLCRERGVGILAMKGLCGGLLTDIKAAFAFLRQYDNVMPIWGMQKISELEEFLSYENDPPILDDLLAQKI